MLKAQWQNAFQYRAMIFIWMFETFFVPFVMLMIRQPIVGGSASLQSLAQNIITYYLFLPVTTLITGARNGIFFAGKVRSGELNTFLLKPTHHMWFDITSNLTEKLLKLLLLIFMFFVGAIPAEIILDKSALYWVSITALIALGVFMGMKRFFSFALKYYSSASS